MRNLTEITKTWPTKDGWSVSPGTDFSPVGARILCGVNCEIGDDDVQIGDCVIIGDNWTICAGIAVPSESFLGDWPKTQPKLNQITCPARFDHCGVSMRD